MLGVKQNRDDRKERISLNRMIGVLEKEIFLIEQMGKLARSINFLVQIAVSGGKRRTKN